jgi:hypothetical protein
MMVTTAQRSATTRRDDVRMTLAQRKAIIGRIQAIRNVHERVATFGAFKRYLRHHCR